MNPGTARITHSIGVKLPGGTRNVVTVTLPPSTNNLFATSGGKRVKTREYKDWIAAVVPLFMDLKRPELPCRVCISLEGKVPRQRDGDNFLKPVMDALVTAQVIPGDSLVYIVGASWGYWPDDGRPRLSVEFAPE